MSSALNIQERIKEPMEVRGWSEYKLAKMSGLPQSTISHLFRRNNSPSFNTIEAICNAFTITPAQFLADGGEPVVLTKEQKEILLLWGSLNQEQQNAIKFIMKNFNY